LDTFVDPNVMARVRFLFVSEAPPGGSNLGAFFHNPDSKDNLRWKLFRALSETRSFANIRTMPERDGLRRFFEGGLYLLPSFNFPCARKMDPKKNANPSRELLAHSAVHLAEEIRYIKPLNIFTLGKSALFTILEAFGNTTHEARRVRGRFLALGRIGPFVGTSFPVDIGEPCHVHVEKWPRIVGLKNADFSRLIRDLQEVVDTR
jgi:uracil-DNA glycosylase